MPVDITWTTLRNDAAVRKLIWLAICQWSVDNNGELELNHGKSRGQIEAGSATKTPEAGPTLAKSARDGPPFAFLWVLVVLSCATCLWKNSKLELNQSWTRSEIEVRISNQDNKQDTLARGEDGPDVFVPVLIFLAP
jgi:hypothetical protein